MATINNKAKQLLKKTGCPLGNIDNEFILPCLKWKFLLFSMEPQITKIGSLTIFRLPF